MAENIDFDEIEKENIYDNVEEAKHNPTTTSSSEIKKPQSAFAIYIKENKDQIKAEM
jgi:predicted RNA methylase